MKEDSLENYLVHVMVKFEIKKINDHTIEGTALMKTVHLFKKLYSYPE